MSLITKKPKKIHKHVEIVTSEMLVILYVLYLAYLNFVNSLQTVGCLHPCSVFVISTLINNYMERMELRRPN